MTVRELMTILLQVDPEATVCLDVDTDGKARGVAWTNSRTWNQVTIVDDISIYSPSMESPTTKRLFID